MRIFNSDPLPENPGATMLLRGSHVPLNIGTIVRSEARSRPDLELRILEAFDRHRTGSFPARSSCVVMSASLDDLKASGAPSRHIHLVRPMGILSRHDWVWVARALHLCRDAGDRIEEAVSKYAEGYWSGLAASENPVWEYLCHFAEISETIPETSDPDHMVMSSQLSDGAEVRDGNPRLQTRTPPNQYQEH